MFKTYDKEIESALSDGFKHTDLEKTLAKHKLMISRIQHERLIHLLVTIFVGVVMTLFFMITLMTKEVLVVFIDGPLLILFTAYIFHYRFLENTTQSWYKIEDSIKEKIN